MDYKLLVIALKKSPLYTGWLWIALTLFFPFFSVVIRHFVLWIRGGGLDP